MDKRFVSNAIKRKERLQSLTNPLWTCEAQKTQLDTLSEATQGLVCSWWHSEMTVSPNKKDVVRKRVEVKVIKHPHHYLQESQVMSQSLINLYF